MSTGARTTYATLRELGELGREIERRRGPDPYPQPRGPAPSLEDLRRRRRAIERVAAHRGARAMRVFGSVARGQAHSASDLDLIVEMEERRGLLAQAGLQGDLEELLGCPVHVTTTSGLHGASRLTRERIEREAVPL